MRVPNWQSLRGMFRGLLNMLWENAETSIFLVGHLVKNCGGKLAGIYTSLIPTNEFLEAANFVGQRSWGSIGGGTVCGAQFGSPDASQLNELSQRVMASSLGCLVVLFN